MTTKAFSTGQLVDAITNNGTGVSITGTANISGLTASSAVATDASKNLVSVTNTGTGNNVLATAPTISAPVITGHSTIEGVTPTGSTGTGNLVFATSPTLTTPTLGDATVSSLNGGQLAGFRNRIINGDMRVAQRGTSYLTNVAGAGVYGPDRFFSACTAATAAYSFVLASDGSLSKAGMNHLYTQTVTAKASLAAGDYQYVGQKIEGYNIGDLKFGTAFAKTITISFRARVDNVASAVISVGIRNTSGNRSYIVPITITNASANYSVTIPGDTTGTWATDTTIGIELSFCTACGTTYATASTGTWQSGNYIAANTQTNLLGTNGYAFDLADVQLELGPVATPFEQRPIGTELALCQRYYQQLATSDGFYRYFPSAGAYALVTFPIVPMRASPTGTIPSYTVQGVASAPTVAAGSNFCKIGMTASGAGEGGIAVNVVIALSAEL